MEHVDLENRLIVVAINTDYSVRGICATVEFRGESGGVARDSLYAKGQQLHVAVICVLAIAQLRAGEGFLGVPCESVQRRMGSEAVCRV